MNACSADACNSDMQMKQQKRWLASAIAAALAVLCRQTNVVWAAFIAGVCFHRIAAFISGVCSRHVSHKRRQQAQPLHALDTCT